MRRREAGSKWTPNDLKGAHEWQQKFPEHSHETAIAEAVIERLYLENKAIGERDAATKSAATDFLPWDSEEHANGEAESHAGQLADDHGSVKADAIGSDRPTSEKVADEQLPHGTDIRNGETTHATEPAGRARGAEEAKAAESPANKPVGSG